MKTIDTYLTIILSLMIFYYILMLYLKHVYKPSQSNFTPVVPDKINEFNPEPNLYLTEDTRTTYKTLPPVNPMVLNAQIKTDKPSSGLFTNQSSNTNYYMLDQPKDANLLFDELLSHMGIFL